MKYIYVILLMLFYACDSEEQTPEEEEGVIMSGHANISVLNSFGEDLLNPSSGIYDTNSINIIYIVDGEEQYASEFDEHLGKGFLLFEPEDVASLTHQLRVFLHFDYDREDSISRTLIKWNEEEIDTIDAQFDFSHGSVLATKFWLNDSLVWNREVDDLNAFTIIK